MREHTYAIDVKRTLGEKLGIEVVVEHRGLLINTVESCGLVSHWNQEHPSILVSPGDHLVKVNGVDDPDEMLAELETSSTLHLRLVRYEVPATSSAASSSQHYVGQSSHGVAGCTDAALLARVHEAEAKANLAEQHLTEAQQMIASLEAKAAQAELEAQQRIASLEANTSQMEREAQQLIASSEQWTASLEAKTAQMEREVSDAEARAADAERRAEEFAAQLEFLRSRSVNGAEAKPEDAREEEMRVQHLELVSSLEAEIIDLDARLCAEREEQKSSIEEWRSRVEALTAERDQLQSALMAVQGDKAPGDEAALEEEVAVAPTSSMDAPEDDVDQEKKDACSPGAADVAGLSCSLPPTSTPPLVAPSPQSVTTPRRQSFAAPSPQSVASEPVKTWRGPVQRVNSLVRPAVVSPVSRRPGGSGQFALGTVSLAATTPQPQCRMVTSAPAHVVYPGVSSARDPQPVAKESVPYGGIPSPTSPQRRMIPSPVWQKPGTPGRQLRVPTLQ